MTDDKGKIIPQDGDKTNDEAMLKRISEIKELMEKNAALQAVVESEPRHVIAKTYIEGGPNFLKNLITSMLGGFAYDSKGNAVDRTLAITLMVEDITPQNKKK